MSANIVPVASTAVNGHANTSTTGGEEIPLYVHYIALPATLGNDTSSDGDGSTTVIYNITNKDCTIGNLGVHQQTIESTQYKGMLVVHQQNICIYIIFSFRIPMYSMVILPYLLISQNLIQIVPPVATV